MKTPEDAFHLRASSRTDAAEQIKGQFEVHSATAPHLGSLSAKQKESFHWDVWFEIDAINDSPIAPRLNAREALVSEVASLFAQIVALPSANLYIIRDILNNKEELETAYSLLFALLTLIRSSPPRIKSSERIEQSGRDRALKSNGLFFVNLRKPQEQARVAAAFGRLKILGYRAFEMNASEFAINRELPGGGSSFMRKHNSIEDLEAEVALQEKKKTGWLSWL